MFLSPGSVLWKDCFAKVWLFSTKTIGLYNIKIIPFYQLWIKVGSIGHPVVISKEESLGVGVPEEVDLRFRRTNGGAFSQGI